MLLIADELVRQSLFFFVLQKYFFFIILIALLRSEFILVTSKRVTS